MSWPGKEIKARRSLFDEEVAPSVWIMAAEKSCGAVIFKEKKYLLLHYEGGHWDFVKGHVERGETEKETVLRETHEEVGMTEVSFIEGFRHRIGYYYRRAGNTVFKEVIFYLLESKTDAVRLSREHVGFDWMSFDRAYERLTYKNAKETIRKAHDYQESLEQGKPLGATNESS